MLRDALRSLLVDLMNGAIWQGLERHPVAHRDLGFVGRRRRSQESPRTAKQNRERGKQVQRKARLPA
jgi:hypothetical protein